MQNEATSAEAPKEIKSEGGSKTLKILLAILILLILAGGGFLVVREYSQRSPEPSQKPTKEASPSSTPTKEKEKITAQETTKADEYTGCWNTYTNNTVGYALKYPCDWTIKEIALFSETIGKDVKYITITTPDGKYFLHVGVKKPADTFEITDRTGIGAGDMQQKPEKALTILGVNVIPKSLIFGGKIKEYFYNQPSGTSDQCGCGFIAGFSYTDKISYDQLDMTNLDHQPTAEKILKSLKLL